MNDADPRHGGYGHICSEGCEVWTAPQPGETVDLGRIAPGAQVSLGACEACWASAWVPVPPDDPDAIEVVRGALKGTFIRCDNCWNHAQALKAQARIRALEEALRAIQWGDLKVIEGKRYDYCPWCQIESNVGHSSDCIVRAALDGGKEKA